MREHISHGEMQNNFESNKFREELVNSIRTLFAYAKKYFIFYCIKQYIKDAEISLRDSKVAASINIPEYRLNGKNAILQYVTYVTLKFHECSSLLFENS